MGESTIFGVSARGILALLITASCCGIAVYLRDIGVLKDLAFLVLGFYFGQKPSQSITTGGSNASIISSPNGTTLNTNPIPSGQPIGDTGTASSS